MIYASVGCLNVEKSIGCQVGFTFIHVIKGTVSEGLNNSLGVLIGVSCDAGESNGTVDNI